MDVCALYCAKAEILSDEDISLQSRLLLQDLALHGGEGESAGVTGPRRWRGLSWETGSCGDVPVFGYFVHKMFKYRSRNLFVRIFWERTLRFLKAIFVA